MSVNQSLQEFPELVRMVNENLKNFFNLDWLLVRSVGELSCNFLSACNSDDLGGHSLNVVH